MEAGEDPHAAAAAAQPAARRLRWGVLSTANIGRVAVIPALLASRNGTLVAIGSRDRERARAFAHAHAIPRAHGGYRALLDDPDVDALYIPLPNALHRDWTIRALAAGKHVLCEKPLALTAADCREMGAAAATHGVTLMEAFMYRFHPRTERVVEMVRGGAVGDLRMVRSAFTFRLLGEDNIRLDPEMGGGALRDVGCYCVNVSRTVTGEEPVEVQAVARWTMRGIDEQLAGTLRFPSGVIAHFDCSVAMERREVYEASGTEATLVVPRAFLPGTDDAPIHELKGRKDEHVHTIPGVDEYQLMVEHFADCVLEGRPPRYPAEEAARNLAAIEALYVSARRGGAPTEVESA